MIRSTDQEHSCNIKQEIGIRDDKCYEKYGLCTGFRSSDMN